MGALAIACDASGSKGSPYLTVAGFVSSVADWTSFSEQWTARLKADGIEYFHAMDTPQFRGTLQHWHDREDRIKLREALFQDLMDILVSHVYYYCGCVVINKKIDLVDEELRDTFRLSAFSLAGLSCERQIRKYLLTEWKHCTKMPVELVFEDGDANFGHLNQWLSSNTGVLPITRRFKKDTAQSDGIIIPGFVPLQAADWLAYELGLLYRHYCEGKLKSPSNIRWPMRQFLRLKGDARSYESENIKDVETKFKTLENNPDWDKNNPLKLSEHFLKQIQPKPLENS
jgi:hypothetical protein